MFFNLLDRTFTVHRRTGYVLDPVSLSVTTLAADRTPSEAYAVEVEVASGTSVGSITVSGTSGGSPATQALAFSAAGRMTTTRMWDASSAVTLTASGWGSGWTAGARAVRRDGHPLRMYRTVASAWPGRTDRRQGSWQAQRDGSAQVEQMTIFLAYTTSWTPREGDEFVDEATADRWRVEGVPSYDDLVGTHHWELRVQRAEE